MAAAAAAVAASKVDIHVFVVVLSFKDDVYIILVLFKNIALQIQLLKLLPFLLYS